MSFAGVPIAMILVSLVLLGLGAWVLLRQRWLLQWLKGTAGLAMLVAAVYLSLLALNLYSYDELNPDAPLATVSFRELAPQSFVATVAVPGAESHDYALRGDLWQLDTRVLRWKGLLALFGARPGYQLEQIQGRYLALEDERSRERVRHVIYSPPVFFDIWQGASEGSMLLSASTLSAAFLPMADGAIFEIVLQRGRLEARPLNRSAEEAMLQ
ncbi:hypothetical protein K8B33_02615 [Alcanivorax sp. JB21]|uniref:hypothetical protein n=1 Tax=Alcanivorax limicola TaxID=2874102 RepID=UPI001CC0C6BD|nr:hypothetical protein [Alcanivorax limicola]MBZ2187978.1 hypothetical protein [Alcanivorax limicola]